jgi:nitrogen fixation/metabolism regulation signal transduction histidine kinase
MEPWLESFAHANFQRSADTAHDLKTPLNVAVLSLELLRMRLRKIGGEDDEKVVAYAHAIETELRRLGRIFDAFFLLSTPPKNEAPAAIDVVPICADAASSAGIAIETNGSAFVVSHEARIRQAYKLYFEGALKALGVTSAQADVGDTRYTVTLAGNPDTPDFESTKLFKFYYSDAEGNPDLSLAVARLITETYGGELDTVMERDKVVLRLSLPLEKS